MKFRCLSALLALAGAASAADAAGDAGVRVERVAGPALTAQRLTAIRDGEVVVAGETGEVRVALGDVIQIGFGTLPDAPRAWTAADVAIDLWSGETLLGEIRGGDDRRVTLATGLLGTAEVSLDRLAGVRFLERLALVADPPDLRSEEGADVVHLVGGDRLTTTIESFGAQGVRCTSAGGEKLDVPFSRMTAIRMMRDAPPKVEGTALVVVLRDGTKAIGTAPEAADGRLRMRSVSGFDVSAALADVVAAYVLSDAFAYLSDLPPAKLDVSPFWKPVAGDPNVLWAPRMDRSFSGRPLVVAGRTWVKGIGVWSGTTLTWKLDGKWSEFRAQAGLDDGAGPLGGVVFEVLVDGATKWTSGFVRPAAAGERRGAEGRGTASPADAGRIDVRGAKELTLRVRSGDSEDPYPIQDEADWLGAMLVR